MQSPKTTLSPDVQAMFQAYAMNSFRQLHNLLRTAVVMVGCEGLIERIHLPDDFLEEMAQQPVASRRCRRLPPSPQRNRWPALAPGRSRSVRPPVTTCRMSPCRPWPGCCASTRATYR